MKWIAAEPLFSTPLNLTESRWLIQMSRLCLSCQPCPLIGFSLDLLGSRAESPCCGLFKRKHWKDDKQSLGIELCGSSAQQVEDLTLAWLQGEVCHGWSTVQDRAIVLPLSREKGSKSQKQRWIRETFKDSSGEDSKIKEGLRNSFGGHSRREARCLGKTTGKTIRKLLLFHQVPQAEKS